MKTEQLEIVNKDEAAKAADVEKLRGRIEKLKAAGVAFADAFYDVVIYVRDAQITPAVLNDELKAAGFAPSRISEFKRIAFSTPEIFEEYKSRTIGFKLALEKARGPRKAAQQSEAIDGKDAFLMDFNTAVAKHVATQDKFPRWFPLSVEIGGRVYTITAKKAANSQKKGDK